MCLTLPLMAHANRVENLPNAHKMVRLQVNQLPIAQVLKAVATQANFNIVLDAELNTPVSVDFNSVKVEDVLLALKQMGGLYYQVEGDTLYVTKHHSDGSQGLRQQEGHILWIKHLPALFLAQLLNETLFSATAQAGSSGTPPPPTSGNRSGGGGGGNALAATTNVVAVADPITNSILLKCDAQEAREAARIVSELDIPRAKKTWRLNNVRARKVALALTSTVFTNGSTAYLQEDGGTNNAASGAGATPSGATGGDASSSVIGRNLNSSRQISSANEQLQEGSGSETVMASTGSQQAAAASKTMSLRERRLVQSNLTVNPNGPILLPDSRLNTITILATPEQLQQADEFIQEYDRQRQQVYIELSIIELAENFDKQMTPSFQAALGGRAQAVIGFNANLNGLTSASFTKNPIQQTPQFNAILNFLQTEGLVKIVARPSVLTMNEEEANISIVDEVVQGFSDVRDQNNNVVARIANITGAGINLNILPRIAANGDVSMRVNPIISFPQPSAVGDIQLISQRELVAQNIILKNGESFVLGGLKQSLRNNTSNKIPFIGDIPFIGGLTRTFDGGKSNGELIIMITPHVIAQGSSTMTPASTQMVGDTPPQITHPLTNKPTTQIFPSAKTAVQSPLPKSPNASYANSNTFMKTSGREMPAGSRRLPPPPHR